MKVKFDGEKWIQVDKTDKSPGVIYLDGYLKQSLDNIRKIISKGWDAVILIDGPERSGKSTLAMTIGHYLTDGKLTEQNIVAGLNDCKVKIRDCPRHSLIIVDEGSLVFHSKDAMQKAQKDLLKILDVVGQKNLIFIICLPSLFDLNRQIAVRRSKFLINVEVDQDYNRGFFNYWGEDGKRKLYTRGKKNEGSYLSPSPDFKGKFVDFKPDFYDKYLLIKNKSLTEALNITGDDKFTKLQMKLYDLTYKLSQLAKFKFETRRELEEYLGIGDQTMREWAERGQKLGFSLGKSVFRGDLPSKYDNTSLGLEENASNASKVLAKAEDNEQRLKVLGVGPINPGIQAHTTGIVAPQQASNKPAQASTGE